MSKAKEWQKITYLVVYEGSEGKEVEEVGEETPHIGVAVFSKAFIVEAIYLSDLSRFMIPPKDGQPVAITKFKRDK